MICIWFGSSKLKGMIKDDQNNSYTLQLYVLSFFLDDKEARESVVHYDNSWLQYIHCLPRSYLDNICVFEVLSIIYWYKHPLLNLDFMYNLVGNVFPLFSIDF